MIANDNDEHSILGFIWRCDRIFAVGKGTVIETKKVPTELKIVSELLRKGE